jgi:hypothetical protein
VGTGKASVSEPLTKRRNPEMTSEPGSIKNPGMSPAGALLTGQAVSGVKAARARSAASAWNVGRRVPILPPDLGGERERAKQQELRGAEYRRGARWRTGS